MSNTSKFNIQKHIKLGDNHLKKLKTMIEDDPDLGNYSAAIRKAITEYEI